MKKRTPLSYVLAFAMAAFYMAFAFLIVFSSLFENTIFANLPLRIVLGTVFFAYALFRAYRILKK